MKKLNKETQLRLKNTRERKSFKRKRKGKVYIDKFWQTDVNSKYLSWQVKADNKIIEEFKFELHEFLDDNGYQGSFKLSENIIYVPSNFSLETNMKEVFLKIKQLRSTYMLLNSKEIIIDFSKCKYVDFASLFLIRTVFSEYFTNIKKLQNKLTVLSVISPLRIIESKYESVNVQLLACEMINSARVKESSLLPVSRFTFYKGSKKQSKYSENRKGTVATKMRRYINNCLMRYGAMLTAQEESDFDGIISEILNNAEDHSPFDTWYSFGNFYATNGKENSEFVGEVNLAFMNFGYSIYHGIEATKEQNLVQYSALEKLRSKIKEVDKRNLFSDENLLTLFSLQEGISRLKHEDESRGTGTMTFIRSFQEVGDYESEKFTPKLLIFSGNTIVKCDNKFRPFKKGNRYFISLNNSNDMSALPEPSHLMTSHQNFPGTLLVVKMYLNKEHLYKKIENGSQKD